MRKRLVAFMLAGSMVFGQTALAQATVVQDVPAAEQTVEAADTDQAEESESQVEDASGDETVVDEQSTTNEGETEESTEQMAEQTTPAEETISAQAAEQEADEEFQMYMDYSSIEYTFSDGSVWNVSVTSADPEICDGSLLDTDYPYFTLTAKKAGETYVTISWNEGDTQKSKTIKVVVNEKLPEDGVIIKDDALRQYLLGEWLYTDNGSIRFSADGYISKKEIESLKYLNLRRVDVQSLEGMEGAVNLYSLTVKNATDEILGALENFSKLEVLNLKYCDSITTLDPILSLTNLTTIDLDSAKNLKDVSGISKLTKLRDLNLNNCEGLTSIKGEINFLAKIPILDLSGTNLPGDQLAELLSVKLNGIAKGDSVELSNYGFKDASQSAFSDPNGLFKVKESCLIAQKTGTTTLKVTVNGQSYDVKATVAGASDEDLILGNPSSVDIKNVVNSDDGKSVVLTSNGDLWQTYPEAKKEKSNIKKYVGDWVYTGNDKTYVTNYLTNDNVLYSGDTKVAEDVKEFDGHYALTNSGVLIDTFNTPTKTVENVKDWVTGNDGNTGKTYAYVLKNDGTVWRREEVTKDKTANDFEQILENVAEIKSDRYLSKDGSAYYYKGGSASWYDADSWRYDAEGNCYVDWTNLGKVKVKDVYYVNSYHIYYVTESDELYYFTLKYDMTVGSNVGKATKLASGVDSIMSEYNGYSLYSRLVKMQDGTYASIESNGSLKTTDTVQMKSYSQDMSWYVDLKTGEIYAERNEVMVIDHISGVSEKNTRFDAPTTVVRTDGTVWVINKGIPTKVLNWGTTTEPENKGLSADKDGNWFYYKDGKVDTSYTGFVANEYGTWRVENGKVNFNFNGLAADANGWWYCEGGHVATGYDGLAANEYGWWKIKDGKVDFNYNGLAANQYGWWKITGGAVDFNYNGLAANEYGWWKITGGAVDFNYNGLAANEHGWWKITGGAVDFNYNGLVPNEYGWWKVEGGHINFDFTGIAQNEYGSWYVRGGHVDFSYNGRVKYNGKTYRVTGGAVK